MNRVVAEAGLDRSRIARVGLGTPGTMDIPSGMLLSPGNLPGWWNFPIRDALSRGLRPAGDVCQRRQRRRLRRVLGRQRPRSCTAW